MPAAVREHPAGWPQPTQEVETMASVLSADPLGNPLPAGLSWQEDLERQVPYFTRVYRHRFRYLTPETGQ